MPALTNSVKDRQQFALLFQRSHHRAYRLAYRLTGNADDAADILQDAYVQAWKHFSSFDPARSFEGWLFRILTNRAIDLQRRKKRTPVIAMDAVIQGRDGNTLTCEPASSEGDPAQIVIGKIRDERLQFALKTVPEVYRRALLLCVVDERSYHEIAEMTGCALGTVRSRIHRARTILRSHLKTTLLPEEDGCLRTNEFHRMAQLFHADDIETSRDNTGYRNRPN